VDYGRYNVTFNPKDLYKFRTPSLYNVEKTAPYSHSGSTRTLKEAVIAHYDPFELIEFNKLDSLERHEIYKRLTLNDASSRVGFLTLDEVEDVVTFLKTLSF
jgi:cytochrome c peroxidase